MLEDQLVNQIPAAQRGLAMVFRVFDRLSYALVFQAERAMTLGDKIGQP